MTASTFGWLDHDDGERRRMMEVINLFREKGTLDELGIGTIRDTFAEHFFPGTSTIQSRARYFLFIPWLYRQIESERVPSNRAGRRARELQWRLVQSLQAGGEGSSAGLIGIEAGENLQRLPSMIYWQGLRRWGIRLFEGSIDRYHASLDGYYREERAARTSEAGELLDMAHRNWHGSLPPCPANLLDQTTFALSTEEAEFLSERIRRSCGLSLLAACLTPGVKNIRRAGAPWDLKGLDSLQSDLQQDIADARRYSLVMEGAVLLYNHMLAELAAERGISSDPSRIERYSKALDRWADEIVGEQAELQAWDRPAFWHRVRFLNPRVAPGAIRFSDDWIARGIAAPASIRDDPLVRLLIRERERRLKGSLARLHNPRALEKWSGGSGVGRLTYRWGSAQRILLDILNGDHQ
ncbi:MAG: DUF6361 family protein [Chloroflexota bacterium]|nr:DUF6361 family protein [Chloroflexota bacterium]